MASASDTSSGSTSITFNCIMQRRNSESASLHRGSSDERDTVRDGVKCYRFFSGVQ